jgi:hypothetical protein
MVLSGCGANYSQVGPRVDLQPYGRIALVTFASKGADSAMSALTTQHFAEEVLASQSGIELLELGASEPLVRAFLAGGDASALAQALGRDKNVPAVFVGRLQVSNVKPQGHMGGSGLSVKATVSADLTVQLLSSSSGGTVWRSSANANGTIGRMHLTAGLPSVAVRDPEQAYGEVVRSLVTGVTRDFRPSRVRQ